MLKGFAVVGGLWTFLCGAFAVVYGPSLMQILFGMALPAVHFTWCSCLTWDLGVKPLSVFGLVHSLFKREREPLLDMYRHLYLDLEAGRAEQGFRAFMADFVVDFAPIESCAASRAAGRDSPGQATELERLNRGRITFPIPETR